ncbi:MAG: class I SAM-dependent methyltransferase [Thermodesulfobacteriota bacterium]
MKDLYSSIAHIFRSLRITDSEPVLYMKENLADLDKIVAADVGAGAGRYAKLLFDHIGEEKLFLNCFDTNEYMLKSLQDYLEDNDISNFITKIAAAEEMPIGDKELDCIFSFNSIHHFNFYKFFQEAIRVLKNEGKILVYSRTRTQNEMSIWGQYFPLFRKKESRLYEPDEFTFKMGTIHGLELLETKVFSFKRDNTIAELVERASSRHYSAFFLYEPEEFDLALKMFETNLIKNYPDPEHVEWVDEKIMFIVKKV